MNDSSFTNELAPPDGLDRHASVIDPRLARLAARSAEARQQRTAPVNAAVAGAPAPQRARKRHPAKGSRRSALAMSAVSTLGLAGYFQHVSAASAATSTTASGGASSAASATATLASTTTAATAPTTAASATAATAAASATAATATTATAAAATTTATAAAATGSAALADGTFTGATSTNKWGPVQVQITVQNGTITSVTALQTPNADNKSVSINNRAVPTLNASALSAQSAKIDSVSGATYTSTSYKESLQSAIDAAAQAA